MSLAYPLIEDQPQKGRLPIERHPGLLRRRRGPRAAVACETCRRLKAKCDSTSPCSVCVAHSTECHYRSIPNSHRSKENTKLLTGTSTASSRPKARAGSARILCTHTEAVLPRHGIVFSQNPPGEADGPAPLNSESRRNITEAEDSTLQSSVESISVGQGVQRPWSATDEHDLHGLGEINIRTTDKEFHGPAATVAFVFELQARAKMWRQKMPAPIPLHQTQHRTRYPLLDSIDQQGSVAARGDNGVLEGYLAATQDVETDEVIPTSLTHAADSAYRTFTLANHAIERRCIEHFFSDLHHTYCFLRKGRFLARCDKEICLGSNGDHAETRWSRSSSPAFRALYSAVVAMGALTAGANLIESEQEKAGYFWQALKKHLATDVGTEMTTSRLSRELGHLYFSRTRALLGEFLETSGQDSLQTLFLMSIFCHYTLRPHSSYLYHGLAVRTGMAIGSSSLSDTKQNPVEAIRTWWSMYYHEMELCCLLGRDTSLKDADHYPAFIVHAGYPVPPHIGSDQDESLFFTRSNVELARILRRICKRLYHVKTMPGIRQGDEVRHRDVLDLDTELLQWKDGLRLVLDLDRVSLTELEITTRRKIILTLRFHYARIMIHRPFLVKAANAGDPRPFSLSTRTCLASASDIVNHLHGVFIHRPFVRTWWFNTTYVLNAVTVILFGLLTQLHAGSHEPLLADVENALQIFDAMDEIVVARQSAELTKNVLEIARYVTNARQDDEQPNGSLAMPWSTTSQQLARQGSDKLYEDSLHPAFPMSSSNATRWDSSPGALFDNLDEVLHSLGLNLSDGVGSFGDGSWADVVDWTTDF